MLLEIELFKTKEQTNKKVEEKKIKIALSLGNPSSYFYNKRCNMLLWWIYLSFSWLYKVATFCQCQCHSSCLRTWSIHRRKRQGSSWRDLQISHICNFYSFLWWNSDVFSFFLFDTWVMLWAFKAMSDTRVISIQIFLFYFPPS